MARQRRLYFDRFLALAIALSGLMSTSSIALAHGTPDQVNDPPPQGSLHSFPDGTCQSFVPSKSPLSAIDLRFVAGVSFPDAGLSTAISIQAPGTPNPLLGQSSVFVFGPRFPGEQILEHFDFSPPITVTPGVTYLIEWEAATIPSAVLNWAASFDNPYKLGSFVNCDGTPFPPFALADTNFVTYTLTDTTPPALLLPGNISANATSPAGTAISYVVAATDPDNSASSLTIACTPASGSVFPIGTTTVSCQASDPAGNSANGSFTIKVLGAIEQLDTLIGQIHQLGLRGGTNNSFSVKLQQVIASLQSVGVHDNLTACNALDAFTNEVRGQTDVSLTSDQAAALLAIVSNIESVIPCA